MTTFAERLKNAMEQANMSQSALSEQAGASKATKEGTKIQQGASPYEETAWPNKLKWME